MDPSSGARSSWIAPSILAADQAQVLGPCQGALKAGADWLHIDVMDGHFVPNISFGLPLLSSLRAHLPDAFLDVHLMITQPERYVARFAEAGADLISVHVEACTHLHRTTQHIRALGAYAGVVLNPATPLTTLDHLEGCVDLILLMSVNPGFGGQRFIPHTLDKLSALHARTQTWDVHPIIEIDGGVTASNAGALVERGAEVLVAGSSVFKHPDGIGAGIDALRASMDRPA